MSEKQMPAAVGGWMAWCYGIRELSRESRIATRKAQTEKPASQEAYHAG